jgi:hypothetical protein
MDTGTEAIADAAGLAQVRRQARKVQISSLCLAVALVALALLIPTSQ